MMEILLFKFDNNIIKFKGSTGIFLDWWFEHKRPVLGSFTFLF